MRVKFGVQVPQEGFSYSEIKKVFSVLEELGYYSALVYDHFHPIWSAEDAEVLENWVLLSALAVETERIRLGTLVNCNSYRNPSLLAKMAASLDVISGGRLEFMIGAGWYKEEYMGYGYPFPPFKVRAAQLKEAIEVLKLMWTQHRAYFNGKYYKLEGALCYPKPVQKPYPRVWVGGGGEKYTLRVVAEVGDGTNFFGSPEVFERKLGVLREHCEKVGRDFDEIAKSWAGDVVIGLTETEVENRLKKLRAMLKRRGMSDDVPFEEIEAPRLIGTPEQIMDKLERYLKLGVNYFVVIFPDPLDVEALKIFAEKIIASFG